MQRRQVLINAIMSVVQIVVVSGVLFILYKFLLTPYNHWLSTRNGHPPSILFPFLKATVVALPMKLKKRMAAGINCRRTTTVAMSMKIQRVVPAPFKLIDLANTGEATRVINPTINPTLNPFFAFSIFNSSSLWFSILGIAFDMPRN